VSTPDIRVRLSPEGLQEILFALRKVQEEGRKAGKEAAGGMGTIAQAARELKSLLPAIGLAATVAGFKALASQAVNTADQMGKIQQGVGGTVEEISALNLAFRTNESDQEGMRAALFKTAQVLAQLRGGSKEARDAFGAIGLSAKDLENLDTPRALEAIARRLQEIPPGGERAAAAMKIFGKDAKSLIVALDAVGEQGIDVFIEKAREMGVLIDEDLARAAARANDSLGLIRIQAEGLATQFVSGLAPSVASAMESFNEAITGEGVNGMRTFGEVVGFVVRLVIALFVGMGKEIGAAIAKVGTFVDSVIQASKRIAAGDLTGALDELREGARRRLAIEAELRADLAKLAEGVFDPKKPAASKGGGGGREVADVDSEAAKKAQDARLAAAKAAIANELKLQQERIKTEEQANKRSYEKGLQSLDDYFTKRHELAVRASEAELAALQIERGAVAGQLRGADDEAERIKLRQDLARINAEISAREIQTERELAAIAAEEVDAQKAILDERLKVANTIDELEGNRHEVFRRNLDEEVKNLRELGTRAGQTAEEVEETVRRLSAARSSQFNFAELERRAKAQLEAYNRDAAQIRRDQEAGLITQAQGEQRLIELAGERLRLLQEIAAAMGQAAEASGNDEQIEKAKEYAESVGEIQESYNAAAMMAERFKTAGIEAFQGGLEDLLANVDKIKSLEDAFKSLARTVAAALAKMAAEIIAKQATLALVRAFFGAATGGASTTGSAVAAAKLGGYVRGYAGGGDIKGKPLPIRGPDKIPILAQKGEFVMRRARVSEPGALDFLRAWNAGRISMAHVRRWPRFATGGAVGTPTATPPASGSSEQGGGNLRIINVLDKELVSDALASPAGEKTFLNVVRRNSTSIRRMLSS
jgi:hypothetical protein